MKKNIFVFLVMIILFSSSVYGEKAPGFDNYVDFGISMKELDSMVGKGEIKPAGEKYLVLNGSVTGYTVIDKEESSYTVEVELVNGEWAGVSDVYIYRSVIVFTGREYINKFPARRKSTPDPEEVPVSAGLLVVAKLKETRMEGGMAVPVLEGYYLRVYK